MPLIEAKTNANAANASAANSAEPQNNVQIGRGNRRINRRAVRTYTRHVRRGRAVYRETDRVVYRPNGTTRTQMISRVRVGRY